MAERAPFPSLLSSIVDNRGRTCPTAERGIALIATNCVKNSALYPTYEKVRFVSDATHRSWFRGHPRPGDILLVTKGSPGQVCLVPDPVDFCIAQDMVAVRANEKAVYPPYLLAALRSIVVQDQINNMHVGTLIPHFKKGDFGRLFIPLPERRIQQITGDLYLQISLKIDLNRRINETLDAMARAIFTDWFVDFGPVRAKMDGRDPPGLASEHATLFPNRLGEDGLPEGWTSASLDEIASFLNGIALQKWPADGPEFLPVIKIAQLRAGAATGGDTASTNIPKQYVVRDGDVLFSWSGSLLHRVWTAGDGALNQHLFKVTSDVVPKWFFYHWIGFHMPAFQAIAASKATTMGHIQRHHLTQALTCIPTEAVMRVADSLIGPLFEKAIANDLESRTLGTLRDLILPRLMSGELSVSDAEKLVGHAA